MAEQERKTMNEMYEYMKNKLEEMRKDKKMEITMGFAEAAKLFHLVCYMRQIRFIIEGME